MIGISYNPCPPADTHSDSLSYSTRWNSVLTTLNRLWQLLPSNGKWVNFPRRLPRDAFCVQKLIEIHFLNTTLITHVRYEFHRCPLCTDWHEHWSRTPGTILPLIIVSLITWVNERLRVVWIRSTKLDTHEKLPHIDSSIYKQVQNALLPESKPASWTHVYFGLSLR